MNFGRMAWAITSLGLSFGINHQLKPEFDTVYPAAEYTTATGKLELQGFPTDLPLMTIHIVTVDVVHLGKVQKVRELAVRAATTPDKPPACELFVEMPEPEGVDLPNAVHDAIKLQQMDLAVLSAGRLGNRRSYVTLADGERANVMTGTLRLSEIAPLDGPAAKRGYKAEGRIEVQVETKHGVDLVGAKVSARVVWDDNPTPAGSSG